MRAGMGTGRLEGTAGDHLLKLDRALAPRPAEEADYPREQSGDAILEPARLHRSDGEPASD